MSLSWKLGRFAGIDVYLHATLLLFLAYVGMAAGGTLAVLLVSSLFACVLLHEFGHALAARAYGIPTEDITLYPIGGVARLARMPRKAGPELLIALAGPAVNLAIAGVLAVVLAMGPAVGPSRATTSIVPSFLASLLKLNLVLAIFNLVPAFPMDGGRVLRALLSGWMGRLRATEAAVGIGRMLAIAFGVWSLLQGNLLQAVLAVFIYTIAGVELSRVRHEERASEPGDAVPHGYRWVYLGQGAWQLAPVTVTTSRRPVGHHRPWS